VTPDEFARMIAKQPGSATSLEPGLPINGEGLPQLGPPRPSPGASGPDNRPGLNDSQVYAEFRKPNGTTAWLQKDNSATYLAKGYVLTGNEFNIAEYNDQVRTLDKWRAVGEHPGANRSTWPPPPPDDEPPTSPVGEPPAMQAAVKTEPPSLHGNP
jgi:hypothetical protein